MANIARATHRSVEWLLHGVNEPAASTAPLAEQGELLEGIHALIERIDRFEAQQQQLSDELAALRADLDESIRRRASGEQA
jgi:hypothetical protein